MKTQDWIDAKTACALLGVKPQTLYAYVSRKQVRTTADAEDSRRSLYAARDIEALARQNQRPRARQDVAHAAIRWGDPVLTTGISEVRAGMLWLRGQSVIDCAQRMGVEEIAALLWDVPEVRVPGSAAPSEDGPIFARATMCLARFAAQARPMPGRSTPEIAQDAAVLLAALVRVCLGQVAEGAVHARFGAAWRLGAAGQDAVRRALVLMSDHELNPSTFAVRVCASTGTSLPQALLAGVSALSGMRHGNAAHQSGAILRAEMSGAVSGGVSGPLHAKAARQPYAFGFGHPLYPEGDPRAAHLLALIPPDAGARRALDRLSRAFGQPPNIDAALSAVAAHFQMPEDAPQTLFTIGRFAGWTAHAMEQAQRDEIIRPRARYVPSGAEGP